MPSVVAASPAGVVDAVVALVLARPGRVRLAVDGAPADEAHDLAARAVEALAPLPTLHVRAEAYWRPAGQRLEYGREDPDAWLDDWLDAAALRREVLDPFAVSGRALPALRDPATDRSARADVVTLADRSVVVVSGSVLLGRGLPFDVTVHLRLSAAALARRTREADAWTLPALARYAEERRPEADADLVVRAEDPRRPALEVRT